MNIFKTVKDLIKRGKSKSLYQSGWRLGERVDFIELAENSVPYVSFTADNSTTSGGAQAVGVKAEKKSERKAKKPVEVYEEILRSEPEINLDDLDGKIKLVKKRIAMWEELGGNMEDEEIALQFLRARKKLLKTGRHGFGWQVTTQSLVDKLCKKYLVREVDFYSYSKTAPMEAVKELDKFLTEWKKFTSQKPYIRLIIDDTPAKESKNEKPNDRKKDPILLASSPFGKWYYVLGAWDKEVEIVDELVYRGK